MYLKELPKEKWGEFEPDRFSPKTYEETLIFFLSRAFAFEICDQIPKALGQDLKSENQWRIEYDEKIKYTYVSNNNSEDVYVPCTPISFDGGQTTFFV